MTNEELKDLFPGREPPKDEAELKRDKARKAFQRAVRYGWEFVDATPAVVSALREETWGKAFGHYLWQSWSLGVRMAPEWLVVLLDALVPKYRTEYRNKKTGQVEVVLSKPGEFVSMVVGWCAAGGKGALEERAKPLAAVISLASNVKADVERKTNHFMNEVGY